MPDSIARQIADYRDYNLSGKLTAARGVFGTFGHPVPITTGLFQVRVAPNGVVVSNIADLKMDLARFINNLGYAGNEAFASLSDAIFFLRNRVAPVRLHILVEAGTYAEDRLQFLPSVEHLHIEGLGAGSVHEVATPMQSRADQLQLGNITLNFTNPGEGFTCHGQLFSEANQPVAINSSSPTDLVLIADHLRCFGPLSITGWVRVVSDLWSYGPITINSAEPDSVALWCDGRLHVGAGVYSTPGVAKRIVLSETGAVNGDFLKVQAQDGAYVRSVNALLLSNGHNRDSRSQVTTQWGRASGATGGLTTETLVTFPIPFRVPVFVVLVSSENGEPIYAPRGEWTETGFTVHNTTAQNPIGNFSWVAIGA